MPAHQTRTEPVPPSLDSPPFRRLCANTLTNGISVGGDYVLVGWLAHAATGSPAWVGASFALYHVPALLLGVPAGAVADRFARWRLVRHLELIGFVAIGILSLILAAGHDALPWVFATTFTLGSIRAVHHPVRLSLAYDLVGSELVVKGLASVSVSMRLGFIAGTLLAGTSTQHLGAAHALAFMAASHLAAWLCLRGAAPESATRVADRSSLWRNLHDYAGEMRRNRVLLTLVLVTAGIELFGTSFSTVLPDIATARLDIGAQGLGWMHAAHNAGGLLAGMALAFTPQARSSSTVYIASILGLGTCIIALGSVAGVAFALVVLAFISAMVTTWDILTQSMMQLCVPDRLRGRAMGAWIFAIGSAPLGHLEMGAVAALLGAGTALHVNGTGVIAVIVVALLLAPALRRL